MTPAKVGLTWDDLEQSREGDVIDAPIYRFIIKNGEARTGRYRGLVRDQHRKWWVPVEAADGTVSMIRTNMVKSIRLVRY